MGNSFSEGESQPYIITAVPMVGAAGSVVIECS